MRSEGMWLHDILDAADLIAEFLTNETLESFKKDAMCHRAVIQCLTIISEAVRGVSETTRQSLPDLAWIQIRGMRNILVHQYFDVDLTIVWHAAKNDVPVLADAIRPLLPNED